MPDVQFSRMFPGAKSIEGRYTLPKLSWDDGKGHGQAASPGDKVYSLDEMKAIFLDAFDRGDPLLVSGVGMDWPAMQWDSFDTMRDVVASKLTGKKRNVHAWPDALDSRQSREFMAWQEEGNELSFDNFREVQKIWPELYWSFATNTQDELDALDPWFELPPFIPEQRVSPGKPGWIYAGNPGAGVGWHIDTIGCVCSWAVLLHGRKRWYLRSPPGTPWEQIREYSFVQEPGDMVFWCAGWFHQTSILEESLDIHGYVHLNSFAPPRMGITNFPKHRASEYVQNFSQWIDALETHQTEFEEWYYPRKPMHVLASDCGVEVVNVPERPPPPLGMQQQGAPTTRNVLKGDAVKATARKLAPKVFKSDVVEATPTTGKQNQAYGSRMGRPGNYDPAQEREIRRGATPPEPLPPPLLSDVELPQRESEHFTPSASDRHGLDSGYGRESASNFGRESQRDGSASRWDGGARGERMSGIKGNMHGSPSVLISNSQCNTPSGAIVCELAPVLIFNGVMVLSFVLALCGVIGIIGANTGQSRSGARKKREGGTRADADGKEGRLSSGDFTRQEQDEVVNKEKGNATARGRGRSGS